MPMGPYKNFAACEKAQIAKGKSKDSASKICGKLYWKVERKMSVNELCSPKLLATDTILHNWLENDRKGWSRECINKLHDKVKEEMKKRNLRHFDNFKISESKETLCERENDVEFGLSEYDLRILKQLEEASKIETKLEKIYVENSILRDVEKLAKGIKLPYTFPFAALTEGKFNGIFYSEDELKKHAESLIDKPLSIDHGKSIKDIIGRIIESYWNSETKRIEGKATITKEENKGIAESIENKEINNVSVEVYVTHEESKEHGIEGKDLDFAGLSLVKSGACSPEDGCGVIK